MSVSVLVVAGDVSGDMHAAAVIREIQKKRSDVTFYGIGGEAMRALGVELLYTTRQMSVFGLPEVLKRYRFFKNIFRRMVNLAVERKPDAVLLVDYGGFNIRFAERLKPHGLKILYYVCPQVWASRRSRIQRMAKCVDRLMVIFPFEKELFARTGLRVDFVGHPLVDVAREVLAAPPAALPWQGDERIAMLPGSREQEVSRILPAMLEAAAMLEKRLRDAEFIIAVSSDEMAGRVRSRLAATARRPGKVTVVAGQTRQVLQQARAAMVASGTATIEAALMNCPMVVVYKTSWAFYVLARMLIRVPYIGMVNVVAHRRLCPELIQGDASPAALAAATEPLVHDTPERETLLSGLDEVVTKLGDGGAAPRAAAIVLGELGSHD